jgi:hypothetical protein
MNKTTEFLTASLNAGTTSNLFKVIMAIDTLKKDHRAAHLAKYSALSNYYGLAVTTTMLVDHTGIGHTQMGETLNEGVEQGHILNDGTRNRAAWQLTRERIPQVAGLPSLIDLRLRANGQANDAVTG